MDSTVIVIPRLEEFEFSDVIIPGNDSGVKNLPSFAGRREKIAGRRVKGIFFNGNLKSNKNNITFITGGHDVVRKVIYDATSPPAHVLLLL